MSDNLTAHIRVAAMNLLARREHSRKELTRKLSRFSEHANELEAVLDQLETDNLLCDERFAGSFVRMHINRGHGPARIRQELRQKGVDGETLDMALEEAAVNWLELAESVRQKKFGEVTPEEPREKARQIRFLQYRGFSAGVIMELF